MPLGYPFSVLPESSGAGIKSFSETTGLDTVRVIPTSSPKKENGGTNLSN